MVPIIPLRPTDLTDLIDGNDFKSNRHSQWLQFSRRVVYCSFSLKQKVVIWLQTKVFM